MQIVHNIPEASLEPCVATIGFFDGVHAGHRFLVSQVKEEAAIRGLRSALITFPIHPRKVMKADYRPELLTTTDEKIALLSELGVDYCILLDFTPDISRLTAREFMTDILKKQYQVQALVIGYDHRFGHNRSEGFADYCRYGEEIDMQVILARAYLYNGVHISSSAIREHLHQGNIEMASQSLCYDYFLDGTVVGGYQVGRKIGFPTANLKVDHPDKLIPADGVYAVRVDFDGSTYAGMLNIGHRPTVDNGTDRSIEVHILHFHSDIYNKFIRISFVQYIRPEIKFDGIEALISQLHKDAAMVRELLLSC